MLKYGGGFPFYRLAGLQQGFGIPLPASTQWEIVKRKADRIKKAYEQLIHQAAQGKVIHNDDTTVKILEYLKTREEAKEKNPAERTGMFTTGILSQFDNHRIALYRSGRKHAGENLEDLLTHRDTDRAPPIQMCDALPRNVPKSFAVILANCLAHSRRKYYEITEDFPEETEKVLTILASVYKYDAAAKDQGMDDEERLKFHQEHSKPLMDDLKIWLDEQFSSKRVEPNSSLGAAISYMQNHWIPLTRFLVTAAAPLDNNICEQVLKRAVLHRKNALFYKTQIGADVRDLFMSIIHTCRLNDANPFDYLTALEKHESEVTRQPEEWMPWNYSEQLRLLDSTIPVT